MEKEFKIGREIGDEIGRLEEMYKPYKKLYHRVRFLCCPNQKETAKHNKDYYKKKLKGMRKFQTSKL